MNVDNVPQNEEVLDPQVLEQGAEEQPQEKPKDLRGQLERSFEDDRKATEKKSKQYKSRAREALGEEETPEEAPQETPKEPVAPAPEAFAKEAKAEWANVPPTVQNAIIKREQDMAKGVEELKKRYTDIDQALQPHMEAIRANGHSPGQAVAQLFAWMQALSTNPQVAFPALAQSFNYNLADFVSQQQQQAQPDPQVPGEQPPGEIPPAMQNYVTGLEQKLQQFEKLVNDRYSNLESTFAQQSQAKTQEILDNWSKDKAHFGEVRQLMAQLIQSGAVPLNNGQVDLDAAYDAAIWAHPEVRAKIIAAQEQQKLEEAKQKRDAELLAQKQQAEKARKAGVSVGGGAPGAAGTAAQKGGKGKSVRDSIMEAREQLTS